MAGEVKTIHWDDLGYSATIEPGQYSAEFKVYIISGWSTKESIRYYGDIHQDKRDIESAPVYMSGHIKWDGCSNVQFDEQEKCMLHFCGRKDAMKVGELFNRLYEEASKNIERVDLKLMD